MSCIKFYCLLHSCNEFNYEPYKKPINTGVVLNFRSCAPIQPKKTTVEGTVHCVFRSTSTWQKFDKAPKLR